jgi:hypothetical protein
MRQLQRGCSCGFDRVVRESRCRHVLHIAHDGTARGLPRRVLSIERSVYGYLQVPLEAVVKKVLQSGGPATSGTRAEYVKWFDDKVQPRTSVTANVPLSQLQSAAYMPATSRHTAAQFCAMTYCCDAEPRRAEHLHRRFRAGRAGHLGRAKGPGAVRGPLGGRREGCEDQRRGGGAQLAQPAAAHAAASTPQQGTGQCASRLTTCALAAPTCSLLCCL